MTVAFLATTARFGGSILVCSSVCVLIYVSVDVYLTNVCLFDPLSIPVGVFFNL